MQNKSEKFITKQFCHTSYIKSILWALLVYFHLPIQRYRNCVHGTDAALLFYDEHWNRRRKKADITRRGQTSTRSQLTAKVNMEQLPVVPTILDRKSCLKEKKSYFLMKCIPKPKVHEVHANYRKKIHDKLYIQRWDF